MTLTHIAQHKYAGGSWLLATRAAAPALRTCVPEYVGYAERSVSPIRRVELPHPNITVIVNLGAPLEVHSPAHVASGGAYRSFVAGLFDTVALTGNTGDSSGIELNLTPLGMWQLLGVPMHELANSIFSLDALIGRESDLLEERLRNTATWDDRFDLLDAVLTARLERRCAPAPAIQWAWEQLTHPTRKLSVSAIANELQWSRRRLGVAFREHIGMTPKTIDRIVRFDRAVRLLRSGNVTRWSMLAYECGYADQAHFTREFREFAGMPPGEFRRRNGGGMAGIPAE